MKITLIVAMARNRVIGRDNQLPWRLSSDLKRFKALTMGHHVIMGRKTYDSIGRPLRGRTFIVVSRSWKTAPEGVTVVRSVEEALETARGEEEVLVLGGAEIFRLTLPIAHRLHLTLVHADVEGDVLFPEIEMGAWRVVSREDHEADDKNEYPYSFLLLERKASTERPGAERTDVSS